jgi:hypothetical protein
LDYEWEKRGGDFSQSYSFGAMVGLAQGLATSISATAGDETGSTEWQSMQPTLHFSKDLGGAISIGFSLGYQIALSEADHEHTHVDVGCDPDIDLGPDAPPCVPGATHSHGEAHSHSLMHNHGVNAGISRLIVEIQLAKGTVLVGNFFSILPEGDELGFGYALGLRHKLTSQLNIGLESIGAFENNGEHAMMAAAYWEPVESLIFKMGVGTGLNSHSADFMIRTGVVWNF